MKTTFKSGKFFIEIEERKTDYVINIMGKRMGAYYSFTGTLKEAIEEAFKHYKKRAEDDEKELEIYNRLLNQYKKTK